MDTKPSVAVSDSSSSTPLEPYYDRQPVASNDKEKNIMCYPKPGPRCEGHLKQKVATAERRAEAAQARLALLESLKEATKQERREALGPKYRPAKFDRDLASAQAEHDRWQGRVDAFAKEAEEERQMRATWGESPRQMNRERYLKQVQAQKAKEAAREASQARKAAEQERVKEERKANPPTKYANAKPNTYGGRCPECEQYVEPGAGILVTRQGKKRSMHRPGECPTAEQVEQKKQEAAAYAAKPHPNKYAGKCGRCEGWVREQEGLTFKRDGNWYLVHGADTSACEDASEAANIYQKPCSQCGGVVGPRAGRSRKVAGKWVTFHSDGDCMSEEEVTAERERIAKEKAAQEEERRKNWTPKPNQYAGRCVGCGGRVPAGLGFLIQTEDGYGAVHKFDSCMTDADAMTGWAQYA
ncbi:hypothetical protein Lsed01_00853 [Demequina sediminis]|uniref:Uncharacterized protein n=1 Tax=Demequina sediminis TaxID=1930058 RepID=A0ABP9WH39_9MICO|nr:hypothetical protein [Demequina sediminis]BDZ62493.1 hypothetical protein GCM10025873_22840 [Demequina sediminis]